MNAHFSQYLSGFFIFRTQFLSSIPVIKKGRNSLGLLKLPVSHGDTMAFSWQAAVYKKFSIRHGSGGTAPFSSSDKADKIEGNRNGRGLSWMILLLWTVSMIS